MPEPSELVGLAEIAELFGVSKQVVANWRVRHEDFPRPIAELKSGPVWRRADVTTWGHGTSTPMPGQTGTGVSSQQVEGERAMAVTATLANMKGGVGKSTLTHNLAWYFAAQQRKKVLAIDLDPQFNLSQYMMNATAYQRHIATEKPTVFDIFEVHTPSSAPKKQFAPAESIVSIRKPYSYNGQSYGGSLDLIPSRLDLSFTLKNPSGKEHLLGDFLDEIRGNYDLVLIDSPPTPSILTDAAYLASDYVLVPVRPEFLSTIGLPLIVRSLEDFRARYRKTKIDVAGIVFNAAGDKREHDRSRAYVANVSKTEGWYVFSNEISASDSYPNGSRAGLPMFQTPNARETKKAELAAVAMEFAKRVGL